MLMVVVGASLLAYFSWHNLLLRFTLVPTFLAAFTFGLAAMGDWLARREEALAGTAAMLRGGAVCLVPVNFMILPLLARDAGLAVGVRQGALVAGSLVFLGLFAWGLRRWCRAVHPPLTRHLAPALLIVNALLPIAAIAALQDPAPEWLVVVGCYAVVAVAGWLTLRFLRHELTLDLMNAGRVPWFFGATLALTLVEVFALAHWALDMAPPTAHYGGLCVLLGALVLQAERRVLELRQERDRLGSESFLGYAAIVLGIALALPHPEWRVLVLLLAGVIWLVQAGARRGELHQWLGLTLLVAGGAALGLHPQFPRGQPLPDGRQAFEAVGLLGLALAGLVGGLRVWSRRWADKRLSGVAMAMQPLVLALTALAAIMAQWHAISPPLTTGAVLAGSSPACQRAGASSRGIFRARKKIAPSSGQVKRVWSSRRKGKAYWPQKRSPPGMMAGSFWRRPKQSANRPRAENALPRPLPKPMAAKAAAYWRCNSGKSTASKIAARIPGPSEREYQAVIAMQTAIISGPPWSIRRQAALAPGGATSATRRTRMAATAIPNQTMEYV